MADTKIVAAIAVVAVVMLTVGGVGATLLGGGGGNDNGPDYYEPTTRLLVYGNANNDNYLDQKDVDFIQDILDKKTVWDPVKNARADANVDGKISQEDVDIVKKFLEGKSETMYYNNWDGNIRSISYPLTGNIGGYDTNTLDVLTIIGVEDRMTASGDTPETIAKYNTKMYPGAAGRCVSIRGDSNNYDIEKIISSGVKILFGSASIAGDDVAKNLEEAKINVIQLPIGFYGKIDSSYTIVTVATMMNIQKNVKEYVEYVETLEKKVADSVDKIKSKYGQEAFCIMYRLGDPSRADQTTTGIDTLGVGPGQFADVMNILRLPITPTITVPNGRGFIREYPIEGVLATNPSILFVETFNTLSSNMTDDEIKADFQHRVSLISHSDAYNNNRVITTNYEVMGSTPGLSAVLAVAGLLWPDCFDYEQGLDFMNQYYRDFTHAGKDFDVREHFGYAPLLWGKDNTH